MPYYGAPSYDPNMSFVTSDSAGAGIPSPHFAYPFHPQYQQQVDQQQNTQESERDSNFLAPPEPQPNVRKTRSRSIQSPK